MKSCCRRSSCLKFLLGLLAVLAVPLAVILAAVFETPAVTRVEASADSFFPTVAAGENAQNNKAVNSSMSEVGSDVRFGSGQMFDRIAPVYDLTNKYLSLGLDMKWREHLVHECLLLKAGDKMLDLATGTADVGILAAQKLKELGASAGADAAVTGLDPSAGMLQHGVHKVESEGLNGIVRLVVGDAQDMSSVRNIDGDGKVSEEQPGLQSDSIDKISMSFGIRNVPDRSKAFHEMHRILKKDAKSRVCILEVSLPTGDTFLSGVARSFIQNVVPMIGKLTTLGSGSDEYKYLERSILEFPRPTDFAKTMTAAGLSVQTITSFAYGAINLYSAIPLKMSGGEQAVPQ